MVSFMQSTYDVIYIKNKQQGGQKAALSHPLLCPYFIREMALSAASDPQRGLFVQGSDQKQKSSVHGG